MVRSRFLRGIITGCLISAAVHKLFETREIPDKKGLLGMPAGSGMISKLQDKILPDKKMPDKKMEEVKIQGRNVLRRVGKAVNEVGRSMNDYIKN